MGGIILHCGKKQVPPPWKGLSPEKDENYLTLLLIKGPHTHNMDNALHQLEIKMNHGQGMYRDRSCTSKHAT